MQNTAAKPPRPPPNPPAAAGTDVAAPPAPTGAESLSAPRNQTSTLAQTAPTSDPAQLPRLERSTFPHQPAEGGSQLPCTIANVEHLLASYGVRVAYDVVKKKVRVTVPGQSGAADNRDSVALCHAVSLAALNGIPQGNVPAFVAAIADRNLVNPVAEWIARRPWDGVDRLQAFYDTLIEQDVHPRQLKEELLYRWLLGAVAAAFLPVGFRTRGVLTLQGRQSIGKTAWVNALVPDPILREQLVKLDHHLDANSKDSVITAVTHWIVEIGELDSSFRKDIARLKGFLTSDRDKLRRPYARVDSEYPRRTVFCATVNDPAFLVDASGNSRFWVIPVKAVNYQHGIDMQQLFAQVKVNFDKGEPWWLEPSIERCLEALNAGHRAVSAVRERIAEALDLERAREDGLPALSAIELLRRVGIEQPSNSQCKEANAALREMLGEPKRIHGINKWRVPFRQPSPSSRSPDRYSD